REGLRGSNICLFGTNPTIACHRGEHGISSRLGSLCVPVWRIARRALNHPSNRRRFAQRQVVEFFAEINMCCLFDAANSNRATLPEVYLVTVKREDVLLR